MIMWIRTDWDSVLIHRLRDLGLLKAHYDIWDQYQLAVFE